MSDTIAGNPALAPTNAIRLFLCGDVMTGRGIDQVLPHPCDPLLRESHMTSALGYVELAERANGLIPRRVPFSYVWGAALDELDRAAPDLRIINLETSITRNDEFASKGINYRMSPENVGCLLSANIDCCALANNHVLDFGRAGLLDTLSILAHARIAHAGAGRNFYEASAPAVFNISAKGRVAVFSFASGTSGVPLAWAATPNDAGVKVLAALDEQAVDQVADEIARATQPNDIVVVSVHWGPNWGYEVPHEQRRFAHRLIDRASVAIVHGHSSHHAKAIEVYRGRLILYGCGDFISDYEGITGYEAFRGDLPVMYLAEVNPASRALSALQIVPLKLRRFQLVRPTEADIEWMWRTLDRECRRLGARVVLGTNGRLTLAW